MANKRTKAFENLRSLSLHIKSMESNNSPNTQENENKKKTQTTHKIKTEQPKKKEVRN